MIQKLTKQLRESLSALSDGEASELELHRVMKNAESNSEARATWQRYQLVSSLMREDTEWDVSIDLSDRIRAAIDGEDVYNEDSQNELSQEAQEASFDEVPYSSGLVQEAHRASNDTRANPGVVAAQRLSWRDYLAKGSIAATVAAAVIVGIQMNSGGLSHDVPQPFGQGQLAALDQGVVTPAIIQQGIMNTVPEGFDIPVPVSRNASGFSERPVAAGNHRYTHSVNTQNTSSHNTNTELMAELNYLMQLHAEKSSAQGGLGMLPFARMSHNSGQQEAAPAKQVAD